MGITSSKSPGLLHSAQRLLQFSSTKTTVSIPNDVIFNILSRISVKLLCRFRCVSKGWHALISDPAFVARHKSLAKPLLIVGSHWDESLRLIDIDGNVVKVIKGIGRVRKLICTSRDNLLCAISQSGEAKLIDLASREVPMTCRKNGLLGFGCTIQSSVYKMVYIDVNVCEILTVGDGIRWRPMPLPPTSDICYSVNPVLVNGVVHLMLASQLDENSVLCFDLAIEKWKKGIIGLPNVDLLMCDPMLCDLNGSLCMAQPDVGSTNIWVLTNPNKIIWVKVYTIPFYSSQSSSLIPLRMLRDDHRLLLCSTIEKPHFSMVQFYDACSWIWSDMPVTLLGVHDTNFSSCSLDLESFVLAKS